MNEYLKINYNQLIALGQYIRNKRIQKKLELKEIALKLGISVTYLSNLELGKYSNVNPIILLKIGKILDIDHLKLYKIAGYPNRDLEDVHTKSRLVNKNSISNKIERLARHMELFNY